MAGCTHVDAVDTQSDDGSHPSQAVLDAELPPSTMRDFDRACEKFYFTHGDAFKSFEDAQLFFMLPLDKKQRYATLRKLTKSTN